MTGTKPEGSKAAIQPLTEQAIAVYHSSGIDAFVAELHATVLSQKVKFPVLEYAATLLYKALPPQVIPEALNKITDLQTIGGNTIAGRILQLRLSEYFDEALHMATGHIIKGDAWYVCDIIGERVMGHALLTEPERMLPILRQYAHADNKWIVRCIGVAGHYAVKKGLKKRYAEELFGLLLELAGATEFHTKKGIGWAAKTMSKFHPEIIEKHRERIDDAAKVRPWFRTKVKIGLGRTGKYANRYTS